MWPSFRLVFYIGILFVLIKTKSSVYVISVFILILFLSMKRYFKYFFGIDEKVDTFRRAVLITGCDTGFGHHLAKRLDSKGFSVFACCLFAEGAGAIDLRKTCSDRLKILPLDVTKDESVANVLQLVEQHLGSEELWALVNNAGVVKGFTFELTSVQSFKDSFDVNTFGPIRVTKAFLPLLKKSKGRIVNVTSAAACFAVMDICSYTMSKYATRALTECLSMELDSRGIKVISVEPEGFRTTMASTEYHNKMFEEAEKEINEDTESMYGVKYLEKIRAFLLAAACYSCDKIEIVMDDIESAICEKNPHLVYKPSRNSFVLAIRYLLENLPTVIYRTLYLGGLKLAGHSFYDAEI